MKTIGILFAFYVISLYNKLACPTLDFENFSNKMYWPVDKICVGPHEISQAWGLPLNSMTVIMNAIKKIYNLHEKETEV
jgi:hypothetical protein